jgi:hypothetical protein
MEPPVDFPQFKVFPLSVFNFDDPELIISVKLPPFKIFLSLVFISSAHRRKP